MKKKVFFASCLLPLTSCLFFSSCGQNAPEELERLMKEDPAFRQMITARDQANVEVRLIKQELLSRKKVVDAQAEKLRADYDAHAKAQNAKIAKFRATIDANRALLKREIEAAENSITLKTAELEKYKETLGEIKKIRENKNIALPDPEKQKWDDRVLLMSEKIRPLAEEIQELKLQTRLKRQKMVFLK